MSDEGTTAPQPSTRNAWWLATRRRRSEWQSLMAAGVATFSGRPRSHYEAAQLGDPVLLYVSKPDHAIRAVGVITRATDPTDDGKEAAIRNPQSAIRNGLEVQLAFEVPDPLTWRAILSAPELAEAEPVRQRSSGTLFRLSQEEYGALQSLLIERNPELSASFAALDSGAVLTEEAPTAVREEAAPYSAPADEGTALPQVKSLADLQALTGLSAGLLEEARDLLEDTGQIVLSGPPGTGKTWLARGLASLVAGDLDRVRVVQFHPATTYEDFIEGLKPQVDAWGQVTYAVVPGLFALMCRQARDDPNHYYVLVVDEINRAPLARVFGELLYALEYRGPQGAVLLSASSGVGEQEPFYVPDNLLILGTMNSADRSLALVDYALRRRFRFVELEPSVAVLDRWLAERGSSPGARHVVLDLFDRVNRRLSETLDPDHRLGHSYFMLDPLDAASLDRLWRTALKPLIAEYFVPPAGELDEYRAMFDEAVVALRALETRNEKRET